jgi:hypothetical protein
MTAADRLNDALSASQPVRRSRTTDHIGAFLTAAWLRGDEILAGTVAFPGLRGPSEAEQHPTRCGQCPATWVISDTQREAAGRLQQHQQERHP